MLKIKNKVKSNLIIEKTKLADTFFKRATGLMFYPKKKFNFALIFDLERTTLVGASIHMFFVFFPINLIFLDENKKILEIKKNLKPFQLYNPKLASRFIIELPVSVKLEVTNGDQLDWKN
jgi:uncharacterized membrane protein (UPF0127 family)